MINHTVLFILYSLNEYIYVHYIVVDFDHILILLVN